MHPSQVWARRARDGRVVSPERPCLVRTKTCQGSTARLRVDARPPVALARGHCLRESRVDGPVDNEHAYAQDLGPACLAGKPGKGGPLTSRAKLDRHEQDHWVASTAGRPTSTFAHEWEREDHCGKRERETVDQDHPGLDSCTSGYRPRSGQLLPEHVQVPERLPVTSNGCGSRSGAN